MDNKTLLPFLKTYEIEICQKLGYGASTILEGPLITIGGFSGVGKDTLALGLKKST